MCSDVYDEVTDFQVCEFTENMAKHGKNQSSSRGNIVIDLHYE